MVYADGSVEMLVPTVSDLDKFEQSIHSQIDVARVVVDTRPPVARPSAEACPHCSVRQLCPVYWKWLELESQESPERVQADAEVHDLRKQTDLLWRGLVQISPRLSSGSTVLLRAQRNRTVFSNVLDRSRSVRILNAHILPADDAGGFPTISLTSASEVFALDDAIVAA